MHIFLDTPQLLSKRIHDFTESVLAPCIQALTIQVPWNSSSHNSLPTSTKSNHHNLKLVVQSVRSFCEWPNKLNM